MGGERGRLVIISGPSGAGKTTVVRRLLATCALPLRLSVSATTRAPRAGERPGEDYLFLSHDEFKERRLRGEFLECQEVFGRGDWYGTLRSVVDDGLTAGQWMVLEIDVAGAMEVIRQRPEAVTVFLHPGSMEELERRLRSRGTESEDSIRRRLAVAARELASKDRYRHEVINDEPEQAARDICHILTPDP